MDLIAVALALVAFSRSTAASRSWTTDMSPPTGSARLAGYLLEAARRWPSRAKSRCSGACT
jgi:hypothetical protein